MVACASGSPQPAEPVFVQNCVVFMQAAQPASGAASSSKGNKNAAKPAAADGAGKSTEGKNTTNASSKKGDVVPAGTHLYQLQHLASHLQSPLLFTVTVFCSREEVFSRYTNRGVVILCSTERSEH